MNEISGGSEQAEGGAAPVAMLNTGVDGMKSNGTGTQARSLNMIAAPSAPYFQFENHPPMVEDDSEEEHPDDGGVPKADTDDEDISDDQWNNFWSVVLACASRVKSLEVSRRMEKEARANLTKPNPLPSNHLPAPPCPYA